MWKRSINLTKRLQAPLTILFGLACFWLGLSMGALGFWSKAPAVSNEQTDPVEPAAVQADGTVVAEPGTAARPAPVIDPSVVEAVKRAVPNLGSAPVEKSTRTLREASLAEFRAAALELQARREEMERNFSQGQYRTEAEREKAAMELRALQAEQAEKLQLIAANSELQIDTLRKLKQAPSK